MNNNRLNRREWLHKGLLIGFGGTALAFTSSIFWTVWMAASRFSSARWTRITSINSLPPERAVSFPEKRVAIIQHRGRLAALSLECSHLGCLVNMSDHGFFCPCHGSEFGPQGEIYSGPATKPLDWHAIMVKNDNVWIHSGKKHKNALWINSSESVAEG